MLCQGNQTCKQSSRFSLGSCGYASDGPQALELAHAEGVDTKAKNQRLTSGIVGGWGGVQSEGPSNVLVGCQRLQSLPGSMALVWMGLLPALLWFEWYPPGRPKWFFIRASDALHPFGWHGSMLLVFVPLAQPYDVLGWVWPVHCTVGTVWP